MKNEQESRIRETQMILSMSSSEDKAINHLKDDIRKLNKKITDVQVSLMLIVARKRQHQKRGGLTKKAC